MWFVMVWMAAMGWAQDAPTTDKAPAAAEAAAGATPAEAPRGLTVYKLDPKRSLLAVVTEIDKSSMLSSMGHDHAVVASDFTGSVSWDPTDASKCNVDIRFPVTALVVDPGDIRTKFGLEGATTPDGDKAKITSNFLGKSQLDGSKFPEISFVSSSCSGTSGKVKVTGDLAIRGVAKSITVDMTVTEDGQRFKASGAFVAKHSDFGFGPFTAAFGALRNTDALSFRVDVTGAAVLK